MIQLNSQLSMPISKGMHKALLACGYSLVEQELLHLVYVNGHRRLTFNFGLFIKFEIFWTEEEADKGSHWTVMFEGKIAFAIESIRLLDILYGMEAIDYFAVPEAREAIQLALDEVRREFFAKPQDSKAA